MSVPFTPNKVLITGGTGLVGQALTESLLNKGIGVHHLSSRNNTDAKVPTFQWNYLKGTIDEQALEGVDTIVHLAGAGVADKRWSAARKKVLLESRVHTAQLIYDTCASLNKWPKVFVSASGIGYYGLETSLELCKESDLAASDFFGELCRKWEEKALQFSEKGSRVVCLRTGVVLTPQGGAMKHLLALAGKGLTTIFSDGKQAMPWIALEDLVGLYQTSICNLNWQGAFNACGPTHNNHKEVMRWLANFANSKIWLPKVPTFAARLALGQMSKMLTEGKPISVNKAVEMGYNFEIKELSQIK